MQPYANLSGNSGVESFKTDDESITVKFRNNAKRYKYSAAQNGSHIATMKQLANSGKGLSAYIGKNKQILKFSF